MITNKNFCVLVVFIISFSGAMEEQSPQEIEEDRLLVSFFKFSQKNVYVNQVGPRALPQALHFSVINKRTYLAHQLITLLHEEYPRPAKFTQWAVRSYYETACRGFVPLLKQFLDCGIEIDTRFSGNFVKNYDNSTALMWACNEGHLPAVELLLERGANPSLISKHGFTPLACALANDHKPIVQKLLTLKEVDVNAFITIDQVKPLGWCCARSDRNHFIPQLIQAGADPNGVVNVKNRLPLMSAIDTDNLAAIPVLIERGARVNERNRKKLTPLMFAALKNNSQAISTLLMNNADPDLKTDNGNTALILAANLGHYESVNMLVNGILNPEALSLFRNLQRDKENYFHYLPAEICQMLSQLCALKADVHQKNIFKADALKVALEAQKNNKDADKINNYAKIIHLLKSRQPIDPLECEWETMTKE